MSTRELLKAGLPILAHRSGLAALLGRRYGGCGTVFMLHSVVPDDAFHPDRSLRCPVSRLDRALRALRADGIALVGLDEAVRRLRDRVPGRFAAFTFDDGFADNLTHALPVMERHGAPFTVYVATGMITGAMEAWWLELADLLRHRDRIAIPGFAAPFACPDAASKTAAFLTIERRIHADYGLLPGLRHLLDAAGSSPAALLRREGLDRDGLRRLAGHPLVTIGAHGTRHIAFAPASEAEVRADLADNRAFLEGVIDRPVRHLAYPFGNARACGAREARLARDLGFATAVTTRHGALFPAHLDHLHALPREVLSGDETAASLACKVRGFYRAVESRLGAPVSHMGSDRAVPAAAAA
ncbi:polysaccharide deacetylase family protein [Methylobacterium sp. JK268]